MTTLRLYFYSRQLSYKPLNFIFSNNAIYILTDCSLSKFFVIRNKSKNVSVVLGHVNAIFNYTVDVHRNKLIINYPIQGFYSLHINL